MTFNWRVILLLLLVWAPVVADGQAVSVTVISINAVAGLRYDQVRFKVRPGATVRLVLTNADEMSHNLIITRPGAREEVVREALALGEKGPALNYTPASSKILWAIPVVDPGATKSITFSVPQTVGVYPYVCTFPGHGSVMFGAMYVTEGAMPSIKNDPHIPPAREATETSGKGNAHKGHSNHPYNPVPPYLYRILMPDAGPAAIAVSLPQNISYCWDAGVCRLRYAWHGEFIDPVDYWDKKGEPYAKVLGTVFYRDKTAYPIRIGETDSIPHVEFKGYRLIKSYPEFHYSLNGLDVYELILPKADGTGLERTFRIPNTTRTVVFIVDSKDGVHYVTSAGTFVGNKLKLRPAEAKKFTITMTRVEGVRL